MSDEPYCDHGPFDACRCLVPPFSEPATSPLSVSPGVTPDDREAAKRVTFRPAPAWADRRDEHDEEL
jgi:hypothetical protein